MADIDADDQQHAGDLLASQSDADDEELASTDQDEDYEEQIRIYTGERDDPDDPNTLPGVVSPRDMLRPLRSMPSADFLRLALLAAPMLPGVYLWKAEEQASDHGFFKLVHHAFVAKLAYESVAVIDYKVRLENRTSLVEVIVALMCRCMVGPDKVMNLVCSLSAAEDASTYAQFMRSKLLQPQVCSNVVAAASRKLGDMQSISLLKDRTIYLNCARHFPMLLRDQRRFPDPQTFFRDYWADIPFDIDVGDAVCLGRPGGSGDPHPEASPAPFAPREQNDLAGAMVMMLYGTFIVNQKKLRPMAQIAAMHGLAK